MLRKIFNIQFSIFNNEGFTLIELIIVIGILGILAVAALVALNPLAQLQKGNDVRRKSDLAQVQRALEIYYQDNNKYPIATTAPYQPGVAWGESWQPYMTLLPQDPDSSKHYVYYSDGQTYYIYASLDRGTLDPEVCKNLDANGEANGECPSIDTNLIPLKSCGGFCDYGVSSPDVSP
ncbi:MAG TPA: prepilin-type N-terminal cleavage/methylation domain-containing protein [Patescibacteria group bacterium]|nr:prepilin-type N-terminal cleavage/methylation domain-containing protein [Patescibacteria group bacterium]